MTYPVSFVSISLFFFSVSLVCLFCLALFPHLKQAKEKESEKEKGAKKKNKNWKQKRK